MLLRPLPPARRGVLISLLFSRARWQCNLVRGILTDAYVFAMRWEVWRLLLAEGDEALPATSLRVAVALLEAAAPTVARGGLDPPCTDTCGRSLPSRSVTTSSGPVHSVSASASASARASAAWRFRSMATAELSVSSSSCGCGLAAPSGDFAGE